jgi:putative sigma-54 modulation protein
MKLRIAARGLTLTNEMREYIRRRVQFGLGRFDGRISSLSVRLADVNGPRGGVDKSCDIVIEAGALPEVIVRERAASLHAAIAGAATRAGRALRRQVHLAAISARRTAPQPQWG